MALGNITGKNINYMSTDYMNDYRLHEIYKHLANRD